MTGDDLGPAGPAPSEAGPAPLAAAHDPSAQGVRLKAALVEIAQRRGRPLAAGDRERAEALLTDGAALVLALERRRLSAKRRGRAALLETRPDATTLPDEAVRLAAEERRAEHEIEDLRSVMGVVRRRLAGRITR